MQGVDALTLLTKGGAVPGCGDRALAARAQALDLLASASDGSAVTSAEAMLHDWWWLQSAWAARDAVAAMEPKHKRSLSAKEDAEAAQLVADLPLDEVVADVRGFTFLDDAKVPRYRLALERAVFASSVRDVPARAHGPAAASATSASAAPPAGAGLGINRVLAHMAGNKTVSAVRPRQRRRPDSDSDSDAGGGAGGAAGFVSASDQYAKDIRGGKVPGVTSAPKRAPKRKGFVAPGRPGEDPGASRAKRGGERDPSSGAASAPREGTLASLPPEEMPEVLRNLEPRMIEMIENEIMDRGGSVRFEDIAGLQHAKRAVVESIIWPMQRPDIFRGLRSLPKGILLFGPPGTGKTLVGKAVAHSCSATFFSISASSLTSKWIGEGEKMVRTLFAVAAVKQPSIVFIDEIDSLLQSRSETENESSRRIKTEFLVQLDGAATSGDDMVIVIGATNRPQELDEAARRRFVKRLYIPLPDPDARRHLIERLLKSNRHCLLPADIERVTAATGGYSGADVSNLCKEAAMGPVREGFKGLGMADIAGVTEDSMAPIAPAHFDSAMRQVKSSVAVSELEGYKAWNREFGSYSEDEIFGTDSSGSAAAAVIASSSSAGTS